jgi:hypothetical protein
MMAHLPRVARKVSHGENRKVMTTLTARFVRPIRWRGVVADIVLVGLLSGPLMAPFLYAWGVWAPQAVSGVIYTMGTFVCPQPARAVALYDGNLMAVCMRCYATVLGLLITRLWYAADGATGRLWLPQYGRRALPIFAVLIFAYAAELAGEVAGLWSFDNAGVTVAGLITGLGLGLMFHPFLQASGASRNE